MIRKILLSVFIVSAALSAAALYFAGYDLPASSTAGCTPWTDTAIGNSSGSAGYDACQPDTVVISSDGYATTSATSDNQHVVYRTLCGNGSITARVLSVTPPLIRVCRGIHPGKFSSRFA